MVVLTYRHMMQFKGNLYMAVICLTQQLLLYYVCSCLKAQEKGKSMGSEVDFFFFFFAEISFKRRLERYKANGLSNTTVMPVF